MPTPHSNYIPSEKAKVDFSVLIPVYNSEKSLAEVIKGVREVFSNMNYTYEFVLADDGSTDESWEVIKNEHAYGDISAIQFLRNVGHSTTFRRALEFCRGSWVITMDDDLQHPPRELPKLIKAIETNPDIDVVMGSYSTQRVNTHKSLGARLYQLILKSSYDIPKELTITSFRILNRSIVNEILSKNLSTPHAGFIILSATNKIINIPVEYHARKHGASGMNLRKSITTFLDGLVSNSDFPLKFISILGLLITASAFFLTTFYLIQYFIGNIGISGFSTLVILITAFFGITLLSMSIVGLYIARILRQVNFSPYFSLRSYLPHPDKSNKKGNQP